MARLIIVDDNLELTALLAAAARTRGHEVRAAHSGAAARALLEAEPFDVAIVDLLLPDVPGTELIGSLKDGPVHRVLMSGLLRDPRAAREAREVHGAEAIFVKPFELDALLDTVERLCGSGHAPAEPAVDDFSELDALAPVEDEAQASVEDEAQATAAAEPEELAMPFTRRDQVWARARNEAKASALPAWTNAGALQTGTVPKLLTAFFQARHSGELKLTQGKVMKVVCFEAGVPIYAASNLAGERFGRFCVRHGLFGAPELEAVADLARENNLKTGEAMIQLGLLTREKREQLLVEQVKEIIWSTFPWTKGEFSFSPRRVRFADRVRLEVFPGNLILEGVQRMETLLSLRQKLPEDRRLFPTQDAPYELHELTLDGAQALLLASSDGSKTVEDLVALTELSEREALATLYGLQLLGVLEERRADPARSRISFGL